VRTLVGQVGASRGSERATWSRRAASSGGGGAVDHCRQYNCRRAQGHNQRRTRRSVSFQTMRAAADFFPRRVRTACGRVRRLRTMLLGQEAEGERKHHVLPVAYDRARWSHLEIGSAQLMLGCFVEVLDPVAEAVPVIDLRCTGLISANVGRHTLVAGHASTDG